MRTSLRTHGVRAACAIALCAATAAFAADASDAAASGESFERARAEYAVGHYEQAYAMFARLADAGHRESARIALQMYRYGPTVFSLQLSATPAQARAWQRTIAQSDGTVR